MCFSQYEQCKGPGVKLFQWFTLLRSVNVVDDGAVALEFVAPPLALEHRLRAFEGGRLDHLHLADPVALVLPQLPDVHPAVCLNKGLSD